MLNRLSNLRIMLTILILLAVVPAVGLTLYVDLEQRRAAVLEAQRDILSTIRLAASQEERFAEVSRQILIALAHHPDLSLGDSSRCPETLKHLLKDYPQYCNFGVIDTDENESCSAVSLGNPPEIAGNLYTRAAIDKGQFIPGDYELNSATGKSFIRYYYPVRNDGMEQVAEVLFAELNTDWFYNLAAQSSLPAGSSLALIDHAGTIVARYPGPNGWIGKRIDQAEISRRIRLREEEVVETLDADGIRRLHVSLPLKGTEPRGFLASETPLVALTAKANRNLARNLSVLGLVTAVAFAMARLFGQRFVLRKMAALVSASERLAAGDLRARTGLGDDRGEFGRLGHAFDNMAKALERQDVERRASEEALRRSEETFRGLVENSLTGICIIQDDRVVYVNPEQERLSGQPFQPNRLLDLKTVHPEDLERVTALYDDLVSRRIETADVTFRFLSGSGEKRGTQWAHCRASFIQYQGQPAILVNMTDITQFKAMEVLLSMQDKLTSLGRVTAGIVHELRNPLSTINIHLANLERLCAREDTPEPERLIRSKAIVAQLQSASDKIGAVMRTVTDFSKPSERKFVPMDINRCIEAALNLSATSLRKSGIKVVKSLSEDLPPVQVDPTSMEQIFLNLIGNATDVLKDLEDRRLEISSFASREYIIVTVADSGPGVPPHLRDKIFDPFYSTRKEGMGIGLSISQRIVLDHGGSLEVSASKWGGAEFTLKLLRSDRSKRST